MRRLLCLCVLLSAAALAGPAAATPPISVDELLRADVIVAPGATATADERQRLQVAVQDLATEDSAGIAFPTKFVLVPAPAAGTNLNADAEALRNAAIARLKDRDKLDAVFLLAPRAVGISANAFAKDITSAFASERPTFRTDRIAGVIAMAKRFQKLEATGEQVPGATPKATDRGMSPLVWVGAGAVVLLGALGFTLARRAAKRADARLAEADRDRAADDGAPPPEMRQ